MRKNKFGFAVLSVALCMTFAVTGCVKTEPEQTEITVFAAASLTETLNQITENYKTVNPNVNIVCNFECYITHFRPMQWPHRHKHDISMWHTRRSWGRLLRAQN